MKTLMTIRSKTARQARPATSTLLAVACATAMALSGPLRAQTPGIEPAPLNSNRPPSAAQKAVAAPAPLTSRTGKLVRNARPRPPGESLKSYREANKFLELLMRNENGQIPSNALVRAYEEKQKMTEHPGNGPISRPGGSNITPAIAGIQSNAWTWLGPDNVGGRTRSIIIDPLDTKTMWLGGVDGGVWKTVNGGASWYPLDDFMANLAISCMAMDPTNPNVIYAGTGEIFAGGDGVQGAGIFKTTDGGTNWTQLPSTTSSSFYYVSRLAINPTNSQMILAATGTGIYRSTDGGNSWSQSYESNTFEVAFDPADGSQCIASGSGFVLYSTNGGVSWQTATGISGAGRIEVAYAPSDPSVVYASAEKNNGELYLSTDGGHSYNLRNTGTGYFRHGSSAEQGWYDNCIWVDPTNPNILLVGGPDLWRSMDGGSNLTDIAGYPDYPGGPHPDQQVIVSPPDYDGVTNRTVFVGNDGGIYGTADIYTASPSSGWTDLNNGLGITQFYYGAGNATSGVIIGGTQDNGTLRYTDAGGIAGWTQTFDSDGSFCASDPTDANYFYGAAQYLQVFRSANGGVSAGLIDSGLPDAGNPSTADFLAPIVLDPNNPNVMFAGGASLWRSGNVKTGTPPAWLRKRAPASSFIFAIAVEPGNSSVVWVGYFNGDVYATTNVNAITPSWARKDTGTPNLPNTLSTGITIDPINPNKIYVTFAGFASDNVWRTTDGGTTWVNISGNLPAAPVISLVIAPWDDNTLYVSSSVGVFATSDGGANWSPVNDGPANVETVGLFWVGNELVAATHGRGMFSIVPTRGPDTNAPIVQITAPANNATVTAATLQVNGTASDSEKGNNGIASVTVNGVAASGDTASGSDTANWQSTVLLHAGLNDITAVATDGMGNTTSPQQIAVNYNPPQPHFSGSLINSGALQTTLSGLSAGETLVLYSSPDLMAWSPVQTNLADSATLTLTNLINPALSAQYFRVEVQ